MSTDAALRLLDGIARDGAPCGVAVRTQVALVRAIIDEIERSRANMGTLTDQLEEEVARLGRLLVDQSSAPPASGVYVRARPASPAVASADEVARLLRAG